MRRKSGGSTEVEDDAADTDAAYDQATAGSGAGLPFRAELEAGFGTDLSDVAAFTGKAREMAAIGAEAATRGSDGRIAFADASPGKQTVAHEVAHVLQARNHRGAAAPVQARGGLSHPGDQAEQEAESAARTVVQGGLIHAGSLRAHGGGVMRRTVNVSAGRGATDAESTTRVEDQGNTFEDQVDVWTRLLAWKNGTSITFAFKAPGAATYANVTRVPRNNDALRFFYQASVGIRRKVFFNEDGMLTHICANMTPVEVGQIMGLCDFPLKWKIQHWFGDVPVQPPGQSRTLMLRFIRNSPLGQRLDTCRDEPTVELLTRVLADDHPENVFGDQIVQHLYPDAATQATFDAAHPKFAAWRGAATKLDAEARWALVGADPVANIAKLKTEMVMGGRNKWQSLIEWGPRGLALTDTMRQNIDKAALTAAVSVADRAELFLTRWNHPFTDPGAPFNKVRAVWKQLMALPPGAVTSDLVQGVSLDNTRSDGAYNDMVYTGAGFGTWWTGTTGSISHTKHTVRHEVGHAVDTATGGFSNLASKPPILWKKWLLPQPWLQEILRYMDASGGAEAAAWQALMTAAYNNAPFVSPFGPWTNPPGPHTAAQKQQKLWHRVASAYNAGNDIKPALRLLKRHGKHTASPGAVRKIIALARAEDYPGSKPVYLRDHYFVKKYGEHFSYHKAGANQVWARNGRHGISAYTLCSPYEYYADMFAAYYATRRNRDANVPGWMQGYFRQLSARHERAGVDSAAGGVGDTTAFGNQNAPQAT